VFLSDPDPKKIIKYGSGFGASNRKPGITDPALDLNTYFEQEKGGKYKKKIFFDDTKYFEKFNLMCSLRIMSNIFDGIFHSSKKFCKIFSFWVKN